MSNNRVSRSSRQATRPYAMGGRPHISPLITPQPRPISLPQLLCTVPTLHRLLRYAARRRIVYDLRHPPSHVQPLSAAERLDWIYEPATFPSSLSLTLVCTILPEQIIVFPSGRGYDYVTLNDVLSAVHEAYQRAEPQPAEVERTETESIPILFSHSMASTRYMWAGLSDYVAPGTWLLHIEEPH